MSKLVTGVYRAAILNKHGEIVYSKKVIKLN
jgi:hypothetical protein